MSFPSPLEIWKSEPKCLHWDFTPIVSTFDEPGGGRWRATFWVSGDGLRWAIAPRHAALLEQWRPHAVAEPFARGAQMHCRIPCSAVEAQQIADVLTSHPTGRNAKAALPGHQAAARPDMRAETSLLMTPRLCDLRWQAARDEPAKSAVIAPCNQAPQLGIVEASAQMNRGVCEQLARWMSRHGRRPRIVADPGKIWAISNQVGMTRTVRVPGTGRTLRYRAAVNYGWHLTRGGFAAVTSGQRVLQPGGRGAQGMGHDRFHRDYSQLVAMVAGWCEVQGPGEDAPRWRRTEDVYRDESLCRLVTHDGVKLRVTRYEP